MMITEYPTEKIRNIALLSHSGAGKTTFLERALFDQGTITRMGTVAQGNTVSDFESEAIERKSSTSLSLVAVEHRGHKINFIDTPGYLDFMGDVTAALRACDGVAVFIEAVSGVEVGTEQVWYEAKRRNKPTLLVVNKFDRESVSYADVMQSIQENLIDDRRVINLQLPVGEGVTFRGVVDLVTMRGYGKKGESFSIPDEMIEEVQQKHLELLEAAAEGDDTLMERYFEQGELSHDEIIAGLRGAMGQELCVPIVFCSAELGIATDLLMAVLERLMPDPTLRHFTTADGVDHLVSNDSPHAAFIFKTREDQFGKTSYLRIFGGDFRPSDHRFWNANTNQEVRIGSFHVVRGKELMVVPMIHAGDICAVVKLGEAKTGDTLTDRDNPVLLPPMMMPEPIYHLAIHPVTQTDVSKLNEAIHRLQSEDPTIALHHESATNETILSGLGDVHLQMAVRKLSSRFGVRVTTSVPRIPYRETITGTGSADYTHKKQTGGAGQYGRVLLRVESLDDDTPFEFGEDVFGGAVSAPFIAATEKGCRQAIESGPFAGYPVWGVRAIIYDGKEHPVDSKEIAFQVAGREAFREAMLKAQPTLLEPLYNIVVTAPDDKMGDVLSDFNTRRARVLGMDQIGHKAIVRAEVPLAEMQNYLVELRSLTAGRGIYQMTFSQYGRVPTHLQAKIIAESKARATHHHD